MKIFYTYAYSIIHNSSKLWKAKYKAANISPPYNTHCYWTFLVISLYGLHPSRMGRWIDRNLIDDCRKIGDNGQIKVSYPCATMWLISSELMQLFISLILIL